MGSDPFDFPKIDKHKKCPKFTLLGHFFIILHSLTFPNEGVNLI